MKRRDFLEKIPALIAPFLLNGIPIRLLGENNDLYRLAASNPNSDRVLVLIQLHGGNDGLNALIPIDQYSNYYALRSNIAIPQTGNRKYITLDSNLPSNSQVGLHPDMTGMKALYDQGKVAIVQGVAYENLNQSHFRSRDIWFMGGSYNDYFDSGWAGRYLDKLYPGYPDAYPTTDMPDPLAIEVGDSISLLFHRDTGIPTSLSIGDPDSFFNLINTTGTTLPTDLSNTNYGNELQYILGIDKESDKYADRLKTVYDQGSNTASVVYPSTYPLNAPSKYANNQLTPQLKMIARLLSGGCKTRIFLISQSGFDTHAGQVEKGDPSSGAHAAMLYNISSAMKAFQDDLKGLGLEDRVMSVTFSEFGRRASSNASYGTDHGTSAPMFVFGKCVKPGVVGTNPDLSNLDNGNLRMQYDYRQVFTPLIEDWMGATPDAIQATFFNKFIDQKADIVSCSANPVGIDKTDFVNTRYYLNNCYPNPTSGSTTFSFYINGVQHVTLNLYDTLGRKVRTLYEGETGIGLQTIPVDLSALDPGSYVYTLQAGDFKASKSLVVVR
jgi:uncharacterized protein (DUF1501 family)